MSTDKKKEQNVTTNLNQANGFSEEDLCRIKDFQIGDLPKNSGYVHPFRATFIDERNNNPVKRLWDGIDAHVSHYLIIQSIFLLILIDHRLQFLLLFTIAPLIL
jgi:hypothetical protein